MSMEKTAPQNFEVGIIGLGDMGCLYANCFAQAGLKVRACDKPELYNAMKEKHADAKFEIMRDGYAVVRLSNLIFFSVEAENIDAVVGLYGPAVRVGAVVGAQTSVKGPEIKSFEKHLPADTHIVTVHSLHGPAISPKGQIMVVIRHRCTDDVYRQVLQTMELLESRIVEMSCEDHDKVTADTQVATHLAFEAMGTAWKNAGKYPWEDPMYVGGIENIKVLMALRIYSMKYHVYSGLAFHNVHAQKQVHQYAASVQALWRMMIQEEEEKFTARILTAGRFVFGHEANTSTPLLLPDSQLAEYSLDAIPPSHRRPNSHLSLLAMVDCWHQIGINPYAHLICQTPVFRLRLGIAEYIFKDPVLLNETIHTALYNKHIRGDDMEFYAAVREWATIIYHGDTYAYMKKFNDTRRHLHSGLGLTELVLQVKRRNIKEDSVTWWGNTI
eukprot:Ihof_evm2s427 gene=Ihof_evmTU2s427